MSTLHPADFTEDKLDLRGFSEKLEKYLLVDHDFIEGSLVVSLNAPFGSGKSTFLSMWRNDLETRRATDPTQPLVITLNAWESDYCGDPLLSVITGLIKALEPISDRVDAAIALREAAKDVWWFGIGLANSLVDKHTGIDVLKAGDLAEKKKAEREPKKTDQILAYEERVGSLTKLKDVLRSTFEGKSPAFIFVDELDRCRPDYAVQYLETIKHVFDIHGLIFVLAVDYDQLSNSAKALFGAGLNFEEYFRKFAHRSFSLPELSFVAYQNIAHCYAALFLAKDGKRASRVNIHQNTENITHIIHGFRLTLRQIQEVFRVVGHVLSCEPKDSGNGYAFLGVGAVLLAVLKVKRKALYEASRGDFGTHDQIIEALVKALGAEQARWWCGIYLCALSATDRPNAKSLEQLYKRLGLLSSDEAYDEKKELGQYVTGWGYHPNGRIYQIYNMIEGGITCA
jgi:hypothetical protein